MQTVTVVIPIHNEEPSILPLYDRLTAVMERLARPYEIIFVDDASTDRSFDLLANLVETDHRLKVLRLRRNFGQTAAFYRRALGESRQQPRRRGGFQDHKTALVFRPPD